MASRSRHFLRSPPVVPLETQRRSVAERDNDGTTSRHGVGRESSPEAVHSVHHRESSRNGISHNVYRRATHQSRAKVQHIDSTTNTHSQRSFNLLIFAEDFINICSLVTNVPHQETGGNLFGLWTNNGNAVVLVATGPGENCKRSVASFYQDVPYMARVGHSLTQQYPLCHIGEWHSHHQLQLYKPSSGDCSTIRRNYPTGSQGFVLMIANIRQDGRIQLSPYKFTDDISPYQVGDIEVFETKNPFNDADLIRSAIKNGKETSVPQQDQRYFMSSRERDRHERSRPIHPSDDYKSRSRSRSPQKRNISSKECSPFTQDNPHHPQPPSQPRENKRNSFRESRILHKQPASTDKATNDCANERRDSSFQRQESSPNRYGTTAVQGAQQRNMEQHINGTGTSGLDSQRSPPVVPLETQRRTSIHGVGRESSPEAVQSVHHRESSRIGISHSNNVYRRATHQSRATVQHIDSTTNTHGVRRERSQETGQLHPRGSSPHRNSTSHTYNAQQRSPRQSMNDTIGTRYSVVSERPPSPAHQYSLPMSSNTPQWYEADPATMRQTLNFIKMLTNDRNVQITRDTATKDVSFQFEHNYTQWTVTFPEKFPKKGKVKYSESRSIYHQNRMIVLTGSLEDFKYKLKKAISCYCNCHQGR